MIRRMSKADLDAVAELERQSFSVPWSKNLLQQSLDNDFDYCLVLEEEGQIRGYANLRIIAGEGEIERIAVSPQNRRCGYGRKLMEAMEDIMETCRADAAALEVRAGNQAAINLYESCGFRQAGIRRAYYQQPTEDAVIMIRRFV